MERSGVASSVEYRAVDDGMKAMDSLAGASVGDIGRGEIDGGGESAMVMMKFVVYGDGDGYL